MLKIEFEGTDGAGKTTALKYFIEQARAKGLSVAETREVGNPNVPSCVKMREFVLDPKNNLRGETMEFIFSAMRYENDLWLQNLKNGPNRPDFVVSDRGWLSHLSYTDHNVSVEFTEALYNGVMEKSTLLPDVVIYFKVDTQTALQRRVKRGEGMMDAIEMKGIGYQELVRGSFEKYIKSSEGKFKVFTVDANQDIDSVRRQMDVILNSLSPSQSAAASL
ncbi:MAG: dTMP kinase [Leptolyngbyaceae cyanobacterium RM2_2_4]|nr:dTMP kinase [Leptolyngbyaceae cyanobacterium RM2_2_4]